MKLYGKELIVAGLLLAMLVMLLASCGGKKDDSPYADLSNWAYCEVGAEGKSADVFFINPTVYLGDEEHVSWSDYDEDTKVSFVGAINMEKGIYDDNARFFAPFYHQASLSAYYIPAEEAAPVFDSAYKEVKDAFLYYLEHFNNGRPIILAGFSQGADMAVRLLKDVFADPAENELLVACYAIGWRVTEEDLSGNPHIRFAEGEKDPGVVIAFTCEAEAVHDSIIIPECVRSLAINPLNWKTDGTPADRSLNLGACFTDYDGNILKELPHLTGAFIDQTRGALKIPDVSPADYPGVLFEDGIYHFYDYQFFYRNLEQNVQARLGSYLNG